MYQSDHVLITGMIEGGASSLLTGGIDGQKSYGFKDLFLAKYSSDGKKQWIKQFGKDRNDYSSIMRLDSTGNIYVLGYTNGLLIPNLKHNDSYFFLMKYNAKGEQLWIKQDDSIGYADHIEMCCP